jgi:hypothetical protein
MNYSKFTDENGSTIFHTQSTVPGIVMVPPGMTVDDAETIKPDEFHQRIEEVRSLDAPEVPDLRKELDALKAEVAKLKADKAANK